MRWVNELIDLQNLQEVASCNIYSDQDVSGLKMANGPVLVLLPLYCRLFLSFITKFSFISNWSCSGNTSHLICSIKSPPLVGLYIQVYN